uniref:Uncharacterized protein n=1 Tax=Anguilla anguilla TaxID=7936 RepID=A0A0E9Q9E6_ANGAN
MGSVIPSSLSVSWRPSLGCNRATGGFGTWSVLMSVTSTVAALSSWVPLGVCSAVSRSSLRIPSEEALATWKR